MQQLTSTAKALAHLLWALSQSEVRKGIPVTNDFHARLPEVSSLKHSNMHTKLLKLQLKTLPNTKFRQGTLAQAFKMQNPHS